METTYVTQPKGRALCSLNYSTRVHTCHTVAQPQRFARREVWAERADGCEELGQIVPLEVLKSICRMLHGFFQEASHLALHCR